MDTGIIICSACYLREAQYSCICQAPLPLLCASGECADAHVIKKSGLFHCFLPISASHCINPGNHRSFLQWIVALHHTQSRLIDSLSLLDAAIANIEESYQREVIALTALKDKYLARVNQLKEAATEAFHSAVRETTENAVNSEYVPQSDITQWIWTMASSAEDNDTPLFQSEIREIAEDEMTKFFAVKVSSVFPSLQLWYMANSGDDGAKSMQSIKFREDQFDASEGKSEEGFESLHAKGRKSDMPKGQLAQGFIKEAIPTSAVPRRLSEFSEKSSNPHDFSQEFETLSIEEAEYINESDRVRPIAKSNDFGSQRSRECKTCGSLIVPLKECISCSNFCQCSVCRIQTFFDSPFTRSCQYCNLLTDLQLINAIKIRKEKCHVCGLVVDKSEMVKKSPCRICVHCIVSFKKVRFMHRDKVMGMCSQCGVAKFKLEKNEINVAKLHRACCRSEDQGSIQLACGHFVCRNHSIWLKRCRVCQQQTQNQ